MITSLFQFSSASTRPPSKVERMFCSFWVMLLFTFMIGAGSLYGARHYLDSWTGWLTVACIATLPVNLLRAALKNTRKSYRSAFEWLWMVFIAVQTLNLFELR